MSGWPVVLVGYLLAAVVWIALVWFGLRHRRP